MPFPLNLEKLNYYEWIKGLFGLFWWMPVLNSTYYPICFTETSQRVDSYSEEKKVANSYKNNEVLSQIVEPPPEQKLQEKNNCY